MRAFLLVTALLSICCSLFVGATAQTADTSTESVYLYLHNVIRSAFNAQPLIWSIDLASKAQEWASGCHFEHTDGQLGPYGENIAAGTGNFTIMNAMGMFTEDLGELCCDLPPPHTLLTHKCISKFRSYKSHLL
jgi:pathogenesis-related protein 1